MVCITHEGGLIELNDPVGASSFQRTVSFEGDALDHAVQKEMGLLGFKPVCARRGRREVYFDFFRLVERGGADYTACYLERE